MAEIYRPDRSYPANLSPGYRRIPMKGGVKIELGHAVSVVAGYAKIPAAADAATGHVAGLAAETVDNTAGADGDLTISSEEEETYDFIIVCQDPKVLLDGLAYRGSLTQAIMNGKLWISKNVEFNTIFKLERMARSLARSKKE